MNSLITKDNTLHNVIHLHEEFRPPKQLKKKYDEVALVLQGGGALGSYQAGAYEELLQAGIEPDWIAGISIGALNSAIIAGNPPEKRVQQLKAFWETICSHSPASNSMMDFWTDNMNEATRKWLNNFESKRSMIHGQKGFFVPKFFSMMPFQKKKTNEISYYDTSKLKDTLLKFADFDLINNGKMRVSLGVVNVESGEFSYFDNTKHTLKPEHFMASGALPPSFPAVEIDGQFYWDGGLVTNTPLAEILHEHKEKSKLVIQVDLWEAKGKLPQDFNDITERTQDIKFASRNTALEESIQTDKKHSQMIKDLLARIPEAIRKNDPLCKEAMLMSKEGEVDLVHITYKDKSYENHTKAYEFSSKTMGEHWKSGIQDMKESLLNSNLFKIVNLVKTKKSSPH